MTPAAAAARLAGDAIDAHGGLERWRRLRAVTLELSSGDVAFTSRLQPRALRAVTAIVASRGQHLTLAHFPRPGWVSEYQGGSLDAWGRTALHPPTTSPLAGGIGMIQVPRRTG
ncbi:MAG: hypothetical protein ACRD03_04925 [Acidimicrobiales bacterium]